jgi:hypothetical protein
MFSVVQRSQDSAFLPPGPACAFDQHDLCQARLVSCLPFLVVQLSQDSAFSPTGPRALGQHLSARSSCSLQGGERLLSCEVLKVNNKRFCLNGSLWAGHLPCLTVLTGLAGLCMKSLHT